MPCSNGSLVNSLHLITSLQGGSDRGDFALTHFPTHSTFENGIKAVGNVDSFFSKGPCHACTIEKKVLHALKIYHLY